MSVESGFPPVSGPDARILILGSMPGQASLQAQQYYAHPRNAFWPIMAELLRFDPADSYAARTGHLVRNRIALWDVIAACHRPGSLDADIDPRSVQINDFDRFLAGHGRIAHVICNGDKAYQLFTRKVLPGLNPDRPVRVVRTPSTSPAHAAMNYAAKRDAWKNALACK